MRGAWGSIALGALCALGLNARAQAENFDGVEALANKKAAAVALLKSRTESDLAIAANDRLFAAYMNATTAGEGARLVPRIQVMLAGLLDRHGIREAAVVDRTGTFLARTGNIDPALSTLDPKTSTLMQAGLAQSAHRTAVLESDARIDLAAPFVWHGAPQFVVTARQDFTSYKNVLARGATGNLFAVLIDAKGSVLAGGFGTNEIVPGITLETMKTKLRASATGELVGGELHYKMSYRPVGAWTVVAVERIPAPRRCNAEGARLCG